MNYQNVVCFGDSQTFGARSYGCYPLYLAKFLSCETRYEWRAINRSVSGLTARDLWFKVNEEIDGIADTHICCLLIGANDVSGGTHIDLFSEYYRQILRTFVIKRYKVLLCGEIPPIFPDGHSFFEKITTQRRMEYNAAITEIVGHFSRSHLVSFDDLELDDYEDPVHFNEAGNMKVARAFAAAIVSL